MKGRAIMPAGKGRRQPTNTNPSNQSEEDNSTMPDTSTQDSTTEATEVEATPATEAPQAEATEAQAPAEPEGPPAEDVLKDIVRNALSNAGSDGALRPEDIENLQATYRKIPAARRGSVQADIMREALTSEDVNTDAVANVLQEMVKAPTGKTRASRKPEVPAHELAAEAIATLRVAEQAVLDSLESDEVRTQATSLATERLAATLEGEALESFLKGVSKVVTSVSRKARKASSGDGDRVSYEDSLANIIERGDLKPGTVLKHGDDFTATVTKEGIEVKGTNFTSPSTAATNGCGVKSVNGWEFWKLPDGKSLGTLRKK